MPDQDQLVWVGLAGMGVVSIVAWYALLPGAALAAVNDFGLVSVLPILSYGAFALLAAAFAATLARPGFPAWLALSLVVLLIVMLYGLAPSLEGVLRFSPSWRHLGIVDFIDRTGTIRPTLDAYHNWPGMFGLAALLGDLARVTDLTAVATWAPVWFNLAYVLPLYLIFDRLADDRRLVWLSIWIFYLADWIGQDYFSPQAVGFFLFLAVVGVALRWVAAGPLQGEPGGVEAGRLYRLRWLLSRLLDRGPALIAGLSPARRAGLVAVLIFVYAFVVSVHQLTPFFIVASIGALVVLRRIPWAGLPVLMFVMIGAWVAFLAVAYLIGHFQNVAGYVGALAESFTANLTGRLQGSPEHRIVIYVRIGMTAAFWVAAGLGVIRRLRQGRWDVPSVALAMAPFPLFAVQAYGGEMLLRIYLFALPFMALFVAALVLPSALDRPSMRTAGTAFVLSVALMGTFMVTRYGNERLEYFTQNEVDAVAELYRIAPPGTLLVAATPNIAWKNTRYEQYRYRPQGDDTLFGQPDAMISQMAVYPGPVLLILSRSQQAYAEMILGARPGDWETFQRQLLASGHLQVVYRNGDALIARYSP